MKDDSKVFLEWLQVRYGQLKKELDPTYSGEKYLTKKDENGRYVTGVGWLTSNDGIDAIVEAHVTAIIRYIDSL